MSQELAIIQEADVQNAGTVLATTKNWVATYQKKHDALIQLADKEGDKLTAETDAKINDYLVSIKRAAAKAEEDRKPFTSKLNEIIKRFTAEEALLKTQLQAELQKRRDRSAAVYAREEAEARAAEQRKLMVEQEKINMFAQAEAGYRNAYAAILSSDKALLLDAFENADADNIAAVEDLLKSVVGTFKQAVWDDVSVTLSSNLLSAEELAEIAAEAKEGKFEKVAVHYKSEIKAHANHLLEMIPERIREIEEGKESEAAAEMKRQQEEADAQAARQAESRAEEERQKQQQAATAQVQIGQAKRASIAPKGQTIESYTIDVLSREGWADIFKFYLSNTTEDDLGKVKLESMKVFAERQAKSTGEMIESQCLRYEPKYKAVAKAKKAA